jgi:hypothetical protein
MATNIMRKAVLGVAGLALTGGIAAGPIADSVGVSETGSTAVAVAAAEGVSGKPDVAALVPHGTMGEQSRIDLNGEQVGNVKEIIAATKKAGMDERAAVVSIATSLQESKLENLGHLGDRNDHDSQGLFQQRPSSGWGTVEQITDAEYSTTAFLNGLKNVDGWQEMPLTYAAQAVQVSAFPEAYAQWESMAADLVTEHWTTS